MGKQIKISELQAGMVIVQVTQQNGPIKIKKSGLVSSAEMIMGLAEMGVQEVEIDPSQTVEIDVADAVAPLSQGAVGVSTRQLLQSGREPAHTAHSAEPALAEQFSRHLFLPSVQDLPSLWQYYRKGALMAMLMVCGGLAMGWTGGTYQQWKWIFSSESTLVSTIPVAPTSVADDRAPASIAPAPKPNLGQELIEALVEEKAANVVASVPLKPQSPEPTEVVPARQAAPERVSRVKEEDKVTAEQNVISPALLKRFEEAINQLDDEPVAQYQQPIESSSDVPRVDQLPARLMTKLPSMAFSAHMYASNIEERWVRVNGRRMVEGDIIDGKIKIISIEPQRLILNYQGQNFSMAALTDW